MMISIREWSIIAYNEKNPQHEWEQIYLFDYDSREEMVKDFEFKVNAEDMEHATYAMRDIYLPESLRVGENDFSDKAFEVIRKVKEAYEDGLLLYKQIDDFLDWVRLTVYEVDWDKTDEYLKVFIDSYVGDYPNEYSFAFDRFNEVYEIGCDLAHEYIDYDRYKDEIFENEFYFINGHVYKQ